MKKFILLLLFIPAYFRSYSQVYGNEWINYNQSYFKMRLVQDGLYRLTYSTLQQFGVPVGSINGNTIQIFNKGREIPIYVTTNGILGTNDYIEFYGVHNDGEWDSTMYANFIWQGNDKLSLFNDTAYYFLTWSSAVSSNHISDVSNNITNPPAQEQFCWFNSTYIGGSSKLLGYLNQGQPAMTGVTVYASDFVMTEGYQDPWFNKSSIDYTLNTPHPYLNDTINFTGQINGGADDDHYITGSLNGHQFYSGEYSGWSVQRINQNISSSSWLTSPTSTLTFSTLSSISPNDYNAIAWIALKYPRLFDFDNATSALFSLTSNGGNQFLCIGDFNADGTIPILYDFTNKIRMEAVIQNDSEKFVLPPSSFPERKLFLVANSTNGIHLVDTLWHVHFTDFSNPANQGNFIIISHPSLFVDSAGSNQVELYRQWKQSNGYQAITVNILDLYDEFAYGIRFHSSAIKKFAAYITNHWPQQPRYIFIIGKGIEYCWVNNTSYTKTQCLVPTFGYPGSDELLTAFGSALKPAIPVGRIPCINGNEVGYYLEKAQQFVNAQTSGPQTEAHSAWMKHVIHLSGGSSESDQEYFLSFLNNYKAIIEDTLYGGKVFTFSKTSTEPIQLATSAQLDSLISDGVSLVTFYGHSSYNSFDFNLDKPEDYNNEGKYPLLLTNGCLVGNLFNYGHGFADNFVLSKEHGAIGFLGPATFSVSSSLDLFATNFYKNISVYDYGKPLGDVIASTLGNVSTQSVLPVDRAIAEQILFAGDPALQLNTHAKPDFDLETQNVTFDPPTVTAGLDSFYLQVILFNLGRAVHDSIYVDVNRTLPNGTIEYLYHKKILAPYFNDTLRFVIKTESNQAFGLNYFYIKADAGAIPSANGDVDELDESNNTIQSLKLFINADDILPVWPYDYSIVNAQGVTLKASTVNAFAAVKQYVFQIDTTQNFNSPLLQTKHISQTGGVLKWTPSVTLLDNKVYYWRTSVDTLYGNSFTWHNFSFVYIPGSSPGWNQSHYFQFLSTIQPTGNVILSPTRKFNYVGDVKTLGVFNGMTTWVGGPLSLDQPAYYLNGVLIGRWDCGGSGTTLLVAVIDSATSNFWENPVGGLYSSIQCKGHPVPYFQFYTYDPEHWGLWSLFDSVPDKDYILIMSMNNAYITNWDSAQIQHFTNLGLSKITNIHSVVPYVAFLRKGDPTYPVHEVVGDTFTSIIDTSFTFTGHWDNGYIESPLIGPAESWTSLHWKAHSLELNNDHISLQLIGVDNDGAETVLVNNVVAGDSSIAGIDPKQFPYLKLKLNCLDTITRTPVQLDYWRVNYQPVPEAALNPSSFYQFTDTINEYLTDKLGVAVENISPWNMDSMLMKYQITDATNVLHTFTKREKPLLANDTIHATYDFATNCGCYAGKNYLYAEANPDNDQPEQTHFNNYGIINYQVISDKLNPILDVTFDGIHIMDDDLVSAKPEIEIMLKDENKFIPLNDTSEFKIYFTYPDGTSHNVTFDNVNAIFYPADSTHLGKDNTARVTLHEQFLNDGKYQLYVQGYDRSGNASGDNPYRISFEIINKPMISNVLNYPNPFTTSTRFVFTLTGYETPQQMKITIYTVTGKVVREIFLSELGNIHVGNNITQFAYDGTDQFGDKLANGLYFYKMEAVLNGKSMDHYDNGVDSYFKKGIGKMYLMR